MTDLTRPQPITYAELMERGVGADIEGRAIDVVLRCGWPRVGDVLGIKPCIPIPVHDLKQRIAVVDLRDGRRSIEKLKELRDFIAHQLRLQEYVQAIYLSTAGQDVPELEDSRKET